ARAGASHRTSARPRKYHGSRTHRQHHIAGTIARALLLFGRRRPSWRSPPPRTQQACVKLAPSFPVAWKPAHGPVNITLAELTGIARLRLFGRRRPSWRSPPPRTQQACVKLAPSFPVAWKLAGNWLPYNLITTGRWAPFSFSGVADQAAKELS